MSAIFIPTSDPTTFLDQGIALYEVLAEHTGGEHRDAHDERGRRPAGKEVPHA